jgi:hypothetical protein
MTYVPFNSGGSRDPAGFVQSTLSDGVIAQVLYADSGIGYEGWVANGLNYTGEPGGLGTWTTHPSDRYLGQWALRVPSGQIIGYAFPQTFAEEIVAAMTDYPEPDPTLE